MKRLSHPIRAIREPFGTAGLIVAIVALVAAVGGTAFAAAGLNSKQKKEVKKIAMQYAGKEGAAGAVGGPGASGPVGAAGAAGKAGTNGVTGPTGKTGVTGPTGQTGFTETLPSTKSETGTWSLNAQPTEAGTDFVVPISFPIPLAQAGTKAFFFKASQIVGEEFGFNNTSKKDCKVEVGEPACVETGCRWQLEDAEAKPQSTVPGTLCVFGERTVGFANVQNISLNPPGMASEPEALGYGPPGSYLHIIKADTTGSLVSLVFFGTWAVTAP